MELEQLQVNESTKIILPFNSHNFMDDRRLLIPFTSGEHIGFCNHNLDIVVRPRFIMYYGECYNETDVITVAINYDYGFPRANHKLAIYHRPLYGLINYLGEFILKPEYFTLLRGIKSSNTTVQNKDYKYGVFDEKYNLIIPFGKYSEIDGFDRGLARVGKRSSDGSKILWGIINEKGQEVLPLEYTTIYNFYNKKWNTIYVFKENYSKKIPIQDLNPSYKPEYYKNNRTGNDMTSKHFEDFSSSYAQDVMGFCDEQINDAFDRQSDAYWNID